jgi:hypothetical protein
MTFMFRLSTCLAVALLVLPGTAPVFAQFLPPGSSALTVPPPPAPPPPKIEVPVVPNMGDLPSQNYVPKSARPSFGDRITNCLQDGAAAGLGPNDRAAYSRSCANR